MLNLPRVPAQCWNSTSPDSHRVPASRHLLIAQWGQPNSASLCTLKAQINGITGVQPLKLSKSHAASQPHHPVFFFRQNILLLLTFLQVTAGDTCLSSALHV